MTAWKTVTYILSFIHLLQNSKLCSSNNLNVIYDKVNLWSCVTEKNYFILQDEAQGFQWNNAQATI
jgi:hypothetical protein